MMFDDYRTWVGLTTGYRDDRYYGYPRQEIDDFWAYDKREQEWMAEPDYDDLMEREDHEIMDGLDQREWAVWLEEGCRLVPNG